MVEIVPDADTVMTVKGAKKNMKLFGVQGLCAVVAAYRIHC